MNLPAVSTLSTAIGSPFARMTPRERKLLAGLLLIGLIVAPIQAFSWMQDAEARYIEAHAGLEAARLGSRSGMQAQLARQRQEVRDWSWQASSPSVGRVVVQDEVRKLAQDAGMTGVEIRSADKIETAGEVSLVRVEVAAPFDWTTFTAFLFELNSYGKGFLIDSLVLQDDEQPKVRIVLKLPLVVVGDRLS
jgi:type II secretory pathway component PulM